MRHDKEKQDQRSQNRESVKDANTCSRSSGGRLRRGEGNMAIGSNDRSKMLFSIRKSIGV